MVTVCPVLVEVSVKDGQCVNEYLVGGLYKVVYDYYEGITVAVAWTLPIAAVLCCNGAAFWTLWSRHRHPLIGGAHQKNHRASGQILKSAATVGVVYILTTSYDQCKYVLSRWGVGDYILGSWEQNLALLLTTVNSIANPFIYLMYVKTYRQQWKRLCCYRCKVSPNQEENYTHSSDAASRPGKDIKRTTVFIVSSV